ncbi:MAG: hypothetical protein JRM99_05630 [Nitrososphaerota archaeon]|nr:hypothetical protein [Nitrososphaerota archaeon]
MEACTGPPPPSLPAAQLPVPRPDGTRETKAYDAAGNLLTRTTANGSTISYAYDSLNRLVEASYPGSGGAVSYTYDADGNRLSQVSPSARDYYGYDARGRLTNQTEYVDGSKVQTLYATTPPGTSSRSPTRTGTSCPRGTTGSGGSRRWGAMPRCHTPRTAR